MAFSIFYSVGSLLVKVEIQSQWQLKILIIENYKKYNQFIKVFELFRLRKDWPLGQMGKIKQTHE